MSNTISYKKGDIIGDFGIIFIEEIEKHVYPNGNKVRQAIFKCPHCENTFIADISSVRHNRKKSCGCWNLKGESAKKDITSKRYGKLVAVKPTNERKHGSIVWECKCDYGNTAYVSVIKLQSGFVTTCGCGRAVDISNQRFGNLIALYPTDKRDISGSVIWHCKCDCGNYHDNSPLSSYSKANKILRMFTLTRRKRSTKNTK